MTSLKRAVRTLSRNPVFALVAVIAIALGIGLNATCYSLVRAVLLKPLPYRDPAQLAYIWETHPRFPAMAVSMRDYLDWRGLKSFDGLAAYTIQTMNRGILFSHGRPSPVQAVMASHELFPLLGVQPLIGRLLVADDEQQKKQVAVLSESLWKSRFSADPAIVGRSVRVDQEVFTVVGVVPDRLKFPAWAEIWMPLSLIEPQLQESRKFHPLEVVARLRKDVPEKVAQQEIQSLMSVLAAQYPATNGSESASIVPMQAYQTEPVRAALLLVWAAVGLILLIVSVNVAHLILARTAGRERELAIRVALGATRGQISSLLLTENLLLALVGGVGGIALTALLMPFASQYAAARLPRFGELTLDANVMGFALVAVTITAVVFSGPALWNSFRPSLRSAMSVRQTGIGRALVAMEIALAFAALCGAALLVRSFEHLTSVDPGFNTSTVTAMNVFLPRPSYDWEKAQRWFEQRLSPAVRAIPGVRSVANANVMPLTLPGLDQIHRFATRFGVPGQTYSDGVFPIAQTRWVSEDYFQTMGMRLKAGRLLTESDRGSRRYVVNETLARRYYSGTDAVGKQLIFGVADPRKVPVEIVGVVSDVRDLNLELPPEPTIYNLATSMQFALLVEGSGVRAEAIAEAVRNLEPDSVVERVGPLQQIFNESLSTRRFSLNLMTAFGLVAALLAALGVFGVVSHSTARRVKEFGIRMALGASPADVRRLVLAETARTAFVGIGVGVLISQLLTPLTRSMLYGVEAWDAISFSASAFTLLCASFFACWIPAHKASRSNPTVAMKGDD